MKFILRIRSVPTLIVLLLFTANGLRAADPDAAALMKSSDRARGGGLPGVQWEIKLTTSEPNSDAERRLMIKAIDTDSLAETSYPARSKGTKLLQVGRNMWLSRSGLKKPVPISPRQKMTGLAAQGDIASTNYSADYGASFVGEEAINQELCEKLDLRANNKFATYDHIVYWISKERGLGVKADFYSVSGKLLKSATFEYNNQIEYQGKTYPFVSKMVITDSINPKDTTVLEYSNVRTTPLSRSDFDVRRLGDG